MSIQRGVPHVREGTGGLCVDRRRAREWRLARPVYSNQLRASASGQCRSTGHEAHPCQSGKVWRGGLAALQKAGDLSP